MVSKSPKAAPATNPASAPASSSSWLESWFQISHRGSTVAREIRGGFVTFFTMAYIIALNPIIIGTVADKNGNLISGLPNTPANVGMTMGMVAAATALIAGLMTLLMGFWGRFPIGIATGLGLNALVANAIAPTMTWAQAMGLIVWEGLIITVLVLTGFRTAVFKAVPRSLRTGISVGIGLFIAFIGLMDSAVVRKPQGAVPVQLGVDGFLRGWPIFVFFLGLAALIVLYAKRVKGAMLISILGATVVALIIQAILNLKPMFDMGKFNPTGWALNVPTLGSFSAPNLGLLGRVDMFGAFTADPKVILGLVLTIFALLLSDFFDTMGTVVAIGSEAKLLDAKGNPPYVGEILLVDSIAAVAGGLGSVSSNTSYIESASGVGEGARTGLASVVTGALFLLAIVLAPFVNLIPSEAAAPVLLFVGFLMLTQVVEVDWQDIEEGLPAFLTMVLMPFTYSITNGIGAGFIAYVLLKVARGKSKQVHTLMWVVAGLFLIYFLQGVIIKYLGL